MDIGYLLWLQGIRTSSPPVVQAFFSFLGSDAASVAVMLIPCLAYWCLDKRRGLLALVAYGSSWLCNQLLKNTFCYPRPWLRDPRVIPDPTAIPGASGYSFPSGHTQSSASMLVGLGWSWRARRWPLALGVAVTLLVGFSRNFLGVHTPQDVLVGFVEGCLFVLLADRLIPWVDEEEGRDVRVVVAGLAIVAAYLAYVTLKPYPVDSLGVRLSADSADMVVDCYRAGGGFAGILLGWFAERRLVRLETGGLSAGRILLRMAVGMTVVLVAYKPVGHVVVSLLGAYTGQFVRHLLVFILAVAVVPALFAPLEHLACRKGRG